MCTHSFLFKLRESLLFGCFEKVKELINNHTGWTLHLVGLDLNDNYSGDIKEFISENSFYH